MSRAEVVRWIGGLTGLLLWLTIPLIVLEGAVAKRGYRCRGRTFTGEFDDCFSDYIPILEFFFIPFFILVTAYAFARFAFSLYAPPQRRVNSIWWFAPKGGSTAGRPILQLAACLGVAWALWRLLTYPLVAELLPFHLYWGAFAMWFACGALLGLRDSRLALTEVS